MMSAIYFPFILMTMAKGKIDSGSLRGILISRVSSSVLLSLEKYSKGDEKRDKVDGSQTATSVVHHRAKINGTFKKFMRHGRLLCTFETLFDENVNEQIFFLLSLLQTCFF